MEYGGQHRTFGKIPVSVETYYNQNPVSIGTAKSIGVSTPQVSKITTTRFWLLLWGLVDDNRSITTPMVVVYGGSLEEIKHYNNYLVHRALVRTQIRDSTTPLLLFWC